MRPPGPMPSWESLLKWIGLTYSHGQYVDYVDDYLCAMVPDSLVHADFGADGYRYLINLPSCEIATSDNDRVVAEIDIETDGGLDYYGHYCDKDVNSLLQFSCTEKQINVDGRVGLDVLFDPDPGTGSREVFLALPQSPNLVLTIDVDVHDGPESSAGQAPIPGLTPDTAGAYASRVFEDLARVFVPASR
jgi:hypothetical protein